MLAFDLPGHGASSRRGPYFLSRLVDILRENLEDYKNYVLVGHSLGGHLAIEALPYLKNCLGLMVFGTPPVKHPINLEEAFLPDPRMALLFQKNLSVPEMEGFAEGVCKDFKSRFINVLEAIRNTDTQFREDIGISVARGEFADEAHILEKANIPIALLHGAEDPFVSAAYLNSLSIPNLWKQKVHILSKSGHSPHLERPEEFNTLLFDFLKDML